MDKNTNYLKQITVLKMKSKETYKTFSADNKMFPISEDKEDKDLPYNWVAGASRINFSIIEKGEKSSQVCNVNLTADEINDLYDQTKGLYNVLISQACGCNSNVSDTSSTTAETSSCYTETFKMGTYKGKTPAQVADKEILKKQKDFLVQNIAKYPDNQKLVDAITDCLDKIEKGTLNTATASTTNATQVYELINEQEKPKMLSQQDKDGNFLITGIRIACDFSRRLPICVIISNSYAPVEKKGDGRLQVQASKTVNKKNTFVNLSFKDWNMFVTRCQNFVRRYEDYLSADCFKLADKYAWKPETK